MKRDSACAHRVPACSATPAGCLVLLSALTSFLYGQRRVCCSGFGGTPAFFTTGAPVVPLISTVELIQLN